MPVPLVTEAVLIVPPSKLTTPTRPEAPANCTLPVVMAALPDTFKIPVPVSPTKMPAAELNIALPLRFATPIELFPPAPMVIRLVLTVIEPPL